jgi:hypothetical protein
MSLAIEVETGQPCGYSVGRLFGRRQVILVTLYGTISWSDMLVMSAMMLYCSPAVARCAQAFLFLGSLNDNMPFVDYIPWMTAT